MRQAAHSPVTRIWQVQVTSAAYSLGLLKGCPLLSTCTYHLLQLYLFLPCSASLVFIQNRGKKSLYLQSQIIQSHDPFIAFHPGQEEPLGLLVNF